MPAVRDTAGCFGEEGMKDFEKSLAALVTAANELASVFEQLADVLNGRGPVQHDPVCERFLLEVSRDDSAARYFERFWRPPPR